VGSKAGRGLLLGLSLAVSVLSCTAPEGFFAVEVSELQHRSARAPDAVLEPPVRHRTSTQTTASWKVKSFQKPAAYLDWAARQDDEDHRVTVRTESLIRFAKQTHGDVFYLSVEAVPSSSGALVQWTLQGMPD
jgi:hypothetical protein